jgi:rfaE bifunctional protein nucleotidyltransferase chain/domain
MKENIFHLDNLIQHVEEHKSSGNTVGIVTGCFDILHIAHLELFQYAKRHVDFLIVGVDTDIAIRRTKGKSRPIVKQENRAKVLAALNTVDYVLLLTNKYNFDTQRANSYYEIMLKKLNPTYLITNAYADQYAAIKKKRIESIGGEMLIDRTERSTSTTEIIEKVLNG